MSRTRLEDIPNEILFKICRYFKLSDLCFTFLNLNQRFTSIVYSANFLSHTTRTNDELLRIFGKKITQLSIAISYETIDLCQCPFLHSLAIYNASEAQLAQIQPSIFPQIRRLSISSRNSLAKMEKAIEDILSNKYPSLRYFDVSLVHFHRSINLLPGATCNLRSIKICIVNFSIISLILMSCQSLSCLEVRFLPYVANTHVITPIVNTSLKTFIFYGHLHQTTLFTVEDLIQCMPNLKRLHLQVNCSPSIKDLAQILKQHVRHLIQFTCYMTGIVRSQPEESDPDWIQRLHECFKNIRVSNQSFLFHVYST